MNAPAADGGARRSRTGAASPDLGPSNLNGPRLTIVRSPSLKRQQAEAWFRALLANGLDAEEFPAADPAMAALLAEAAELAGRSWSDATLRSYGGAWARWLGWCETRNVAPLPARGAHVAAYAAWLYSGDSPMRPVSVSAQLSAINAAHRLSGFDQPARTGAVSAVQRGARRRWGTEHLNAKEALMLDQLRLVVSAARRAPDRLRDRAAVALAAASLSPAQIAALDRQDLSRRPDGAWTVAARGRAATVRAAGGAACPAAAVADHLDRPGSDGDAVFATARGRMTRQGVTLLLRRCAEQAGVTNPPAGPPDLPPDDAAAVLDALNRPRPAETRDAALLLLGWVGAMRRSSLAALNWDDLTHEDDGDLRVTLRRQKNDVEGAGHTLWAPPGKSAETCPVSAVEAWRDDLARLLGRDPGAVPGTPFLVALDRAGAVDAAPGGEPRRLGPAAVHEAIRRACADAGIAAEKYGSHSLRSGMITEAAGTDGVAATDIQLTSGHKTVQSVYRYIRPVISRRRHPTRKMAL